MVEIYNCKKRLTYSYVCVRDEKSQDVWLSYCEGRSQLWNMFFGWRETNDGEMYFWIPTRKIKNLMTIAYGSYH